MARHRRRNVTPGQWTGKKGRLVKDDEGVGSAAENEAGPSGNGDAGRHRIGSMQLRPKRQIQRTISAEWNQRLRERHQNGEQSALTTRKQFERKEPEGQLSDEHMEEHELIRTLQAIFTNLDLSRVGSLSPGAGIHALANYVIDEKAIPKKKVEKPKIPEDMLEPTFLSLEQAMQRDENFKGKLLDAFMEDFHEQFQTYFSRPNTLTFDKEHCARFLFQHFPSCRAPLIERLIAEFSGRYAVAAWVCFFVESRFGFLMRRYFLHIEHAEWLVLSMPMEIPRRRRPNWLTDPPEEDSSSLANSIREFRARLARFRADYAQLFLPYTGQLSPDADAIAVYAEMADKPLIECIVCTGQFPIARTVCCQNIVNWTITIDPSLPSGLSSHRFCVECLIGHARAATQEMPLAEGGIGLRCMAIDCPNAILFSECRFYIPPNVRHQLNARILEESLGEARVQNLERCKLCNFAIIIEAPANEFRVFTCLKCHAEHCRLCGRPWDEFHLGKPCHKVETEKDQIKRYFENKLSEAVIHRCQRCSLPFVKQMGCNRMYCRCGATQCYVCRAHNIHYNHFCQHYRNPGQRKCKQCNLPCLLWEKESHATKRAIDRVLQEADQMGITLDYAQEVINDV